MSRLPAAVLFGSTVLPLGYVFSGEDRDFIGKTGAVSVLVPIAGLLLGIALVIGSLDSLLASPIRLGVTALGLVEVLVVVGFLAVQVTTRTASKTAVDAVAERAGSSNRSNDEAGTETSTSETVRDEAAVDRNTDAAGAITEPWVDSTEAAGGSWRYVLLGLLLVFVLNPAVVAVLGSPTAGVVFPGLGTVVGLFGLYRVVF